jgi:hypothetical protein
MKFSQWRFCVALVILLLIAPVGACAQATTPSSTNDTTSFPVPSSAFSEGDMFCHRAGVGMSLGMSEISNGLQALFFWTFYQYRFSPLFALEASAHIHHAATSNEEFRYRTVFINSGKVQVIPIHASDNRIAHAASINITGVISPFDDKRFQFGAGLSMRSAGMLAGTITTRLDTLAQTIDRTDTQQFALGANFHGEYLLPLGGNIDVGFRLHAQGFLPPYAVLRDNKPIGFIAGRQISATQMETFPPSVYGLNAGVGAFLRIGL